MELFNSSLENRANIDSEQYAHLALHACVEAARLVQAGIREALGITGEPECVPADKRRSRAEAVFLSAIANNRMP